MTNVLRTSLIIIGFALLISCSNKESDSLPYQQMHSFNNDIENSLLAKFDAILIPGNNLKIFNEHLDRLFVNSIVVDTTIIGFQESSEGYKLIAVAKKDFGEKIILRLTCTKEQYDKYQKFKCQSAYIAANIEQVSMQDIIADVDTLSSEKSIIKLGKEIYLVGSCLDIVETPTIYFYGENNT